MERTGEEVKERRCRGVRDDAPVLDRVWRESFECLVVELHKFVISSIRVKNDALTRVEGSIRIWGHER